MKQPKNMPPETPASPELRVAWVRPEVSRLVAGNASSNNANGIDVGDSNGS